VISRVYSYRRTATRKLLLAGAIAASIRIIQEVIFTRLGFHRSPSEWHSAVLVTACCEAPVLWGVWRYFAAGIRTDDAGITEDKPFGSSYIPWADVQSYFVSGFHAFRFGNVIGPAGRVRFWLGIAHAKELQVEIASRAFPTGALGAERDSR
jgi:hypothetical protein